MEREKLNVAWVGGIDMQDPKKEAMWSHVRTEEVPHRSHVSRTPAQARQTKTKVTKTKIGPELY